MKKIEYKGYVITEQSTNSFVITSVPSRRPQDSKWIGKEYKTLSKAKKKVDKLLTLANYFWPLAACLLFSPMAHAETVEVKQRVYNYDMHTFSGWMSVAPTLKEYPPLGPLKLDDVEAVNKDVNKNIKYKADLAQGPRDKHPDHWQTAHETVDLKTGDCEDIAILKQDLLLRRHMPNKDMLLIVGWLKSTGEVHAVLEVTVSGKRYILDSLTSNDVIPEKIFFDTVFNPAYGVNLTHWVNFTAE